MMEFSVAKHLDKGSVHWRGASMQIYRVVYNAAMEGSVQSGYKFFKLSLTNQKEPKVMFNMSLKLTFPESQG